ALGQGLCRSRRQLFRRLRERNREPKGLHLFGPLAVSRHGSPEADGRQSDLPRGWRWRHLGRSDLRRPQGSSPLFRKRPGSQEIGRRRLLVFAAPGGRGAGPLLSRKGPVAISEGATRGERALTG